MADETNSAGRGPATAGIYTETLARLYRQQGFIARALDIYRHLAHAHPENHQLRVQIAALERQLDASVLDDGQAEATSEELAADTRLEDRERTKWVTAYLERWLSHVQHQRAV